MTLEKNSKNKKNRDDYKKLKISIMPYESKFFEPLKVHGGKGTLDKTESVLEKMSTALTQDDYDFYDTVSMQLASHEGTKEDFFELLAKEHLSTFDEKAYKEFRRQLKEMDLEKPLDTLDSQVYNYKDNMVLYFEISLRVQYLDKINKQEGLTDEEDDEYYELREKGEECLKKIAESLQNYYYSIDKKIEQLHNNEVEESVENSSLTSPRNL